jgi:hypothetical protein
MINGPVTGAARLSPVPSLYVILYAAALLATAAPILIFPVPPLFDYPAHLAREFIIHDLLTRGDFSSMYQLHFAVIPNLGMETVVLPLLFLGVPIEIAGRIFLILIVVLLGTGVIRVHRALFQKTSLFPLLALTFVFNPVFMFGFANYLFGFALALHAFAWWLHSRQKPVVAILPVLLAWAVALFFCHLTAAILFLGLIASYEASLALIARHGGRPSNFPRTLMLLAAPAVVLAVLFSLAPLSTAPQAIETHSIAELLRRIPVRLKALPLYLTAYSPLADALVLLALAVIMGSALWFRRLLLSWPMLIPILGLLMVYVLVPEKWAGTDYIAYRIPIALLFLAFASVDIAWDKRYLPAAAVFSILGLRAIATLNAWANADAQYRPILRALQGLPSHSAIYTGINYQGPFEPLIRMPWAHFESYAAIRNRLFVFGIWADPTQNWIIPTPGYAKRASLPSSMNRVDRSPSLTKDSDMFNPAFMANFDFLLAVHAELYRRPIPPGVRIIARSGEATLFSLHNR